MIKAAAHLSDNRDSDRHLEDAAVLLAGFGDVRSLGPLSKNDRRRLRHVLDVLGDAGHPAWDVLERADAERGRGRVGLLRRAADLD